MIGISPLKRVDSRFLLDPFEPAYLALHRSGEMAERVFAGLRKLEDCCADLTHLFWKGIRCVHGKCSLLSSH